ncbi:MAG: Phosphoglycerate mutase family protein [uncultured bacterium (gcode 4)]|uniref:Phosphoglycerate mutase family protein n=1 Tax=uncultured bacterium (gcode 4) TaxID=1234023 RepID=K2FAA2_9BACT|nr:MAG: Phosphoglycerate mutase family protein [uncultured bacterium (gcode 4)]
MKLYFIRHWETIAGLKWVILWSLPWKLSENWIHEAESIWKFLLNEWFGISKIYTSNLKRSVETWKIISSYLKVPQHELFDIRERESGIAEWKKETDIDWESYEKKPLPYRKHLWWESFLDVRKRVNRFLDSLRNKDSDESILIVTHSVFILMMLSLVMKKTINCALKIRIKKLIIVLNTKNNSIEFISYW